MKGFKKYGIFAGVLFSMAGALVGCTVGSGAYQRPQSHFDFPNSNVIPLGQAHGEATTSAFGRLSIMDADLQEQAILNALKEKGGDLLINVTYTYKLTAFPIIPIYTTTITADGTACKMEIGKQILK